MKDADDVAIENKRFSPMADTVARLAQCVGELGAAIASGECTPEPGELEALAIICERRGLRAEAMRVRRWTRGAP
jgi:hypothetical protein